MALIPHSHGSDVWRAPMETNYLEALDRPNVHLVDIDEAPIEWINESGLSTSTRDYDSDIVVYDHGFDVIVGACDHIAIQGVVGARVRDYWNDGPTTFLGMMVSGFSKLLMPLGPRSGSASINFPRDIETGVNRCADPLQHMRKRGHVRADATQGAEARWAEHAIQMYSIMPMREAKSWFTGYDSNVPREHGRPRHTVCTVFRAVGRRIRSNPDRRPNPGGGDDR